MSEYQPVGKRRMGVQPESNKFRRVRVCQDNLTQDLKRLRRNFGRIRHDPVDHLEAVDIGGMLLHP